LEDFSSLFLAGFLLLIFAGFLLLVSERFLLLVYRIISPPCLQDNFSL
jgi:hypothetical protein